jgi:hypothetical protein
METEIKIQEFDMPRGVECKEWYKPFLKNPDNLVDVNMSRKDGKTYLALLIARQLHKKKKKVFYLTPDKKKPLPHWVRATRIFRTNSNEIVNKHLKRSTYDYIVVDEAQWFKGKLEFPEGTKVLSIGSPTGNIKKDQTN